VRETHVRGASVAVVARRRNVEDLANSGQRWAHDALRSDGARYIYYSAAGFTGSFESLARQDTRVRLISLREMYAP
jgi:hypothetical protein